MLVYLRTFYFIKVNREDLLMMICTNVLYHPLANAHDAKHLHNKIQNQTEQRAKEGVQKNGNAGKGAIDRAENGEDCGIERKASDDVTW